jgi:cytochrome c-type biogenesis protein CcmH/NrfG
MAQTTSRKNLFFRILIIISGLSFAGSTLFGLFGLFTKAFQDEPSTAQSAGVSKNAQLEAQEQGYELVLQREPENQIALKGLVDARLQMNDPQGALEPLEKLIQLNPQEAGYKYLLAEVKQKVNQGNNVPDTSIK